MGGQLGSTLLLWHCIAAPQKYLCRRFAVSGGSARARRFGGHPHSKPASKEIATSASKWWVLKRVSASKKSSSAKNFKLLRQKTSKQKRFTSRKSQKRKVNLNPQNSWPQKTFWVRGRKSRTRNWNLEPEPQRKTQTQHAPGILMPMCCASSGARLKEATTLRDSRRSTVTETISSGYRKHDAVC